MLFALFCIILFAPCLAAFLGGDLAETSPSAESFGHMLTLPSWNRANVVGHSLSEQELPLAEDLMIRSFPKGLSQRRVVVQDFTDGYRATIAQVRQAIAAAARTVRHAYQSIRETKARMMDRLAEQPRMVLAQEIVREGRRSRAAGEKYAQACARLRWSESTPNAKLASALAGDQRAA